MLVSSQFVDEFNRITFPPEATRIARYDVDALHAHLQACDCRKCDPCEACRPLQDQLFHARWITIWRPSSHCQIGNVSWAIGDTLRILSPTLYEGEFEVVSTHSSKPRLQIRLYQDQSEWVDANRVERVSLWGEDKLLWALGKGLDLPSWAMLWQRTITLADGSQRIGAVQIHRLTDWIGVASFDDGVRLPVRYRITQGWVVPTDEPQAEEAAHMSALVRSITEPKK
jgi:hypothetical protein